MDGLDALERMLDALVPGFVGHPESSGVASENLILGSAVNGMTESTAASMKIVVFCPNLIGDTVMATPTFRALRARFPDSPADGRDPAPRRPRARRHDLVRRDHPLRTTGRPAASSGRPAVVNRLRRARPTSRSSCPTRSASAWMAWLAGIPGRVGYVRYGRGAPADRAASQPPRDADGPLPADADRGILPGPGAAAGLPRRLGPARARDHPRRRAAADRAWADLGLRADGPVVCLNTGGAFGPGQELAGRVVRGRWRGGSWPRRAVSVLVALRARPNASRRGRSSALAGHPAVVSLADQPLEPGSVEGLRAAVRAC